MIPSALGTIIDLQLSIRFDIVVVSRPNQLWVSDPNRPMTKFPFAIRAKTYSTQASIETCSLIDYVLSSI